MEVMEQLTSNVLSVKNLVAMIGSQCPAFDPRGVNEGLDQSVCPFESHDHNDVVTAGDVLDDALSVEAVRIRPDGVYLSAEILFCAGGPDVRLYTDRARVVGRWSFHTAEAVVDEGSVDAIDQEVSILVSGVKVRA